MISRRTLLSSTVPAIGAIGAALAVRSAAAAQPDAELLALDAQCAELRPICDALSERSNAAQKAAYAAVYASGRTLSEAHEELMARLDPVDGPCHEAWERLNALQARIRDIPAVSVAGLAVKARMVRDVCALEQDTEGPEVD